jgi:hypothetical protein
VPLPLSSWFFGDVELPQLDAAIITNANAVRWIMRLLPGQPKLRCHARLWVPEFASVSGRGTTNLGLVPP